MEKRKITLQILAEDIKTSNYTNSNDCAITRALRRAHLDAKETGGYIRNNFTNNIICETPSDLGSKVRSMYAWKEGERETMEGPWCRWDEMGNYIPLTPIEPADFTFELEIEV